MFNKPSNVERSVTLNNQVTCTSGKKLKVGKTQFCIPPPNVCYPRISDAIPNLEERSPRTNIKQSSKNNEEQGKRLSSFCQLHEKISFFFFGVACDNGSRKLEQLNLKVNTVIRT